MTPEQLAQAYAETIYGPANAWGQHVHKTLGVSHVIMHELRSMVGTERADAMIDAAMADERARRMPRIKAECIAPHDSPITRMLRKNATE